jgi:hypothetical protein
MHFFLYSYNIWLVQTVRVERLVTSNKTKEDEGDK